MSKRADRMWLFSLYSSVSLGLGETVSWQGTMKREVFTDLYRWLRGSELAPRHFSCDSVSDFNFRCVIKTIIGMSDNVSIWSWRAPLTELVRYHCQILNPVTCVSHSNDSSQRKSHHGDFYKHASPCFQHCRHKRRLHKFRNYVLHAEYFLTDISHLFITTDERGD